MKKIPRPKPGSKVSFVSGSRTYVGTFVRVIYPAKNAGPHFRIKIDGGAGTVATIFANGEVGQSVKEVVA